MDQPISETILVNRKELLRFLDEKPDDSKYHATSIMALAGEDLGAALLARYLTTNASPTRPL